MDQLKTMMDRTEAKFMGANRFVGALVHPAGKTKVSESDRAIRIGQLAELGFNITELAPEVAEDHEVTAGKPLERALLLSQALTQRRYSYVWASRGGFGTTELIRFLEAALPPILPPRLFIGFSDNSFLGNYLAARHPNLTYIHANHAFDSTLLEHNNRDSEILFKLMKGENVEKLNVSAQLVGERTWPDCRISGPCIPFNLSLAESFSTLRHVALPAGSVLFLEDINEDLYRILRKFDSLCNSGLISKCSAIVVGQFTACAKADGTFASEEEIAQFFARKTQIPVVVAPLFGHDKARLPLVAHSDTSIDLRNNIATLTISFEAKDRAGLATKFPANLFQPASQNANAKAKLHFTGVGGTGMAAVAGLFVSASHEISGSDNPIYPPMDEVIKHIGLNQVIGYQSDTLAQMKPDAVVLANVITRRNAELKPNLEMESLLRSDIPTMSFPSALRKFFLHDSTNIVVSGTHGKTSTTSLIAQMLQDLGQDPSLFVGGAPANFQHGFKLGRKKIFVLEGDEYDSALFDKGPKFLHYEPKVALINNIEFDHADIYPNIEAIEDEFYRLACLTRDRGGIVVANADDPRVSRVVLRSQAPTLWFGKSAKHWGLIKLDTFSEGSEVLCKSPSGENLKIRLKMFGQHNAMNVTAAMAVMHALSVIEKQTLIVQADLEKNLPEKFELDTWAKAAGTFNGVKRRFELIGQARDIVVFDDFAHHPTAIATTLDAFKAYVQSSRRQGRLIACFDPRNATMRRSVLQDQLAQSFAAADVVMLGKVPLDLRLKEGEALDGAKVAGLIGTKATYFADNDVLLKKLVEISKPGDTVVFMSSGAFDGLPRKLYSALEQA
jgi:UDP-N-acetylmuramate: L-alanyl-gamma-D-glutamyl-meso-diaminopimelate ligase